MTTPLPVSRATLSPARSRAFAAAVGRSVLAGASSARSASSRGGDATAGAAGAARTSSRSFSGIRDLRGIVHGRAGWRRLACPARGTRFVRPDRSWSTPLLPASRPPDPRRFREARHRGSPPRGRVRSGRRRRPRKQLEQLIQRRGADGAQDLIDEAGDDGLEAQHERGGSYHLPPADVRPSYPPGQTTRADVRARWPGEPDSTALRGDAGWAGVLPQRAAARAAASERRTD